MRHIEEINEHEMITLFLKAEIESPRWRQDILQHLKQANIHRGIIDSPDLTNPDENKLRLHLLGEYRGYRRNEGLFEGFPKRVTWERVALTQNEVWHIKYIDYDYWVALSKGSRLAKDAARTIRTKEEIFEIPNDGFLSLANELQSGFACPELILVRTGEDSDLVLLEGHVRLTAYALVPEILPDELPVLLGTSPDMTQWELY
jgi:hypothetical protein